MVLEQLILNGIIAGGIYALIAIGFSLTYGLLRFLNLAHGSLYVIGAYAAFLFFSAGIPVAGAFAIAIAVGAMAGVVINKTVFKPLREKKSTPLILLLASMAVFIFIENAIIAIFGPEVRTIRTGPVAPGFDFFGAIMTQTQAVIIFVAFATLLFVEIFLAKTKTGKAMRATADNKEIAQVIGIDTERITTYASALSSALAASAGVLISIEQNLEPVMGLTAVLKGFTASVVGGFGSLRGAVAGAFLLGLAENIGVWFLPSGYKDAIAFVILITFLLFRPKGIFRGRD